MGQNPLVLVHKRHAKGTWDETIARGRTQLGLRDFAGKYSGQSSVDPGKGTSYIVGKRPDRGRRRVAAHPTSILKVAKLYSSVAWE